MRHLLLACVVMVIFSQSAKATFPFACSTTSGITAGATGTLGSSSTGHYITFSGTFGGGCYGYGFNYLLTKGSATAKYVNGFNAFATSATPPTATYCDGTGQDLFTAAQAWSNPVISGGGKILTFTQSANQSVTCINTITFSSVSLVLTLSAVSGSLTPQQVWNVNTSTGEVWVPLGQTSAQIANVKITINQQGSLNGGTVGPTNAASGSTNNIWESGLCTAGTYTNSSHMTWGFMTLTAPSTTPTVTVNTPVCTGTGTITLNVSNTSSYTSTPVGGTSGFLSYLWTGPSGSSYSTTVANTTNPTTITSPTTSYSGVYTVSVVDNTGCLSPVGTTASTTVTSVGTSATLPTTSNNGHTLTAGCVESGYTYYYDNGVSQTQYLMGINWGTAGAPSTAPTVSVYTAPGTPAAINSITQTGLKASAVFAMGRSWNIKLSGASPNTTAFNAGTNAISIQFFYDPAALTTGASSALTAANNWATTNFGSTTGHVHPVEWFTTKYNVPYYSYVNSSNTGYPVGTSNQNDVTAGDILTLPNYTAHGSHFDINSLGSGTVNSVSYETLTFATGAFYGGGGTAAYRVDKSTSNLALPVTLISFSALPVNNSYILLDWSTASEINSSGFELQRSTDGINYANLTWEPGAGNSNTTLTYVYGDTSCDFNIVYYYRLLMEDLDGHIDTSEVASAVLLIGDGGFVFDGIWPNPATNNVSINVISNTRGQATLTVTDMIGRTVADQVWEVSPGTNVTNMDMSGMRDGTYTVAVDNGSIKYSKKLVVIH